MESPLRIRRERRCERKARAVIGAKESKTEKEPAGGQVVSARADPQPAPGARQGCYSRLRLAAAPAADTAAPALTGGAGGDPRTTTLGGGQASPCSSKNRSASSAAMQPATGEGVGSVVELGGRWGWWG